jgi:hypothetical protein
MTSFLGRLHQQLTAGSEKRVDTLDDTTIALLNEGLSRNTAVDPEKFCAAPFFWADDPHQVSPEQARSVSRSGHSPLSVTETVGKYS